MKTTHVLLPALVSLILGATANASILKAPYVIGECTPQNLETLKKTPAMTTASKPLSFTQMYALTKYIHAYMTMIDSVDYLEKVAAPLQRNPNPTTEDLVNLGLAAGEVVAQSKLRRAYIEIEPCVTEAARIVKGLNPKPAPVPAK